MKTDTKRLTITDRVTGDTSDGYHTFNELYHHRAVLFSVILKAMPERAWKSKHHHDGTMYDGMFIVGVETPGGQATYHYDIAPYWDMFQCRELERAPEWDGHTSEQAIERIAKLEPINHSEWVYFRKQGIAVCKNCSFERGVDANFGHAVACPNCGAKMDAKEG